MFYCIRAVIFLSLITVISNAYASQPGMKVLSDVPYGKDAQQTLDVYMPADAKDAPVIFMIHGGAWTGGDKANTSEVENKVAHWVPKGFIFISTNYRTLPKAAPVQQAKDIETALRFSQQKAGEWGGSPEKFILMGHSAGAHLVSLVSANFNTIVKSGVTPWLGTVSLDTSSYDIVKRSMVPNESAFYKDKFGNDPVYLKKASPLHALADKIPPFLAICSTQSGSACTESNNFLYKAKSLGSSIKLVVSDFDHNEINAKLGKAVCYTKSVDTFLKKLDPALNTLLKTANGTGSFCTRS